MRILLFFRIVSDMFFCLRGLDCGQVLICFVLKVDPSVFRLGWILYLTGCLLQLIVHSLFGVGALFSVCLVLYSILLSSFLVFVLVWV